MKKGPKYSQILMVRLGGGDPPPPYGQPDRKKAVLIFDAFPKEKSQKPTRKFSKGGGVTHKCKNSPNSKKNAKTENYKQIKLIHGQGKICSHFSEYSWFRLFARIEW